MVEVSLGPEMRSTGEVLGVGRTFEEAIYKGFIGAGTTIPEKSGTILATVRERRQRELFAFSQTFC